MIPLSEVNSKDVSNDVITNDIVTYDDALRILAKKKTLIEGKYDECLQRGWFIPFEYVEALSEITHLERVFRKSPRSMAIHFTLANLVHEL